MSLTVQNTLTGGSVQFSGPVTAGGNLTVESPTDLLLAGTMTAGGTASLTSGAGIGGGPDELISAPNVTVHADTTVGGSGDGTLKIDLTGGSLTAVADVDIGIREVAGPLTVAYVFCAAGGVRLEVADTAGDDDDIVFGPGSTMNVATWRP